MATQAAPKTRKRQEVQSNYATPWKPKSGDVLEGIYKGYDMVPGDRGEKFRSYRIYVDGVDKPTGVAGAFLDSILPRVPIGAYVWITYNGLKDSNNGKAHDFKVETEEGTKLLDIPSDSSSDNF